jgi:hypothetical protein
MTQLLAEHASTSQTYKTTDKLLWLCQRFIFLSENLKRQAGKLKLPASTHFIMIMHLVKS